MKISKKQAIALKAKGLLCDAGELSPPAHKYNARRTIVDGQSFPSQLEANVWATLSRMQANQEIFSLERNDTVRITAAELPFNMDFRCVRIHGNNEFTNGGPALSEWHEAKGMETERFRLLKKLWPHYGPGTLYIWKANKRGVYIAEEIHVKSKPICRHCGEEVA